MLQRSNTGQRFFAGLNNASNHIKVTASINSYVVLPIGPVCKFNQHRSSGPFSRAAIPVVDGAHGHQRVIHVASFNHRLMSWVVILRCHPHVGTRRDVVGHVALVSAEGGGLIAHGAPVVVGDVKRIRTRTIGVGVEPKGDNGGQNLLVSVTVKIIFSRIEGKSRRVGFV